MHNRFSKVQFVMRVSHELCLQMGYGDNRALPSVDTNTHSYIITVIDLMFLVRIVYAIVLNTTSCFVVLTVYSVLAILPFYQPVLKQS